MQIPGSAGSLEAVYSEAPDAQSITTIMCHPHPQYGGSMHDAVLASCETALLEYGSNCLKFNFRGVGASEGRYDNGEGELEDVQSAAAWVRSTHPDHTIWLLGYSFGANMVFKSLVNDAVFPTPARAILIAPPVGMMNFDGTLPAACQLHVIAGDQDDFVDQNKLMHLKTDGTELIPGADHFFGGYHQQLTDSVTTLLVK